MEALKLYDYQQETIDKLAKQRYGLEASEMGTGKTLVGIELADVWRKNVEKKTTLKRPILVITPINTFRGWMDMIARQKPDWKAMLVDRKDRQKFVDAIKNNEHDIYVTHWDGIRLMGSQLTTVHFAVIIADEVHKMSNRKAKVTSVVKRLQAYHRLGMSGTASGDKPWNLWSILNWLDRKQFSSFWKFVGRYAKEENYTGYRKFVGVQNMEELHEIIRPFYVRHRKLDKCCEHHPNGVMPWLPPKVYKEYTVQLTGEQIRVYREMHKNMVAWVGKNKDEPLVAPVIVAKLQRLSQITLATPVFEDDGIVGLRTPSAKLDALVELVTSYEDEQFVVYSSSKLMAEMAAAKLYSLGVPVELLTGDTPKAARYEVSQALSSGRARVVVAVIQAAAEGLDGWQNTCSNMVFLDRTWSSVTNQQAEDRLHRGGQNNVVTIIDILAEKTIDFYKQKALNGKWEQVLEILNV